LFLCLIEGLHRAHSNILLRRLGLAGNYFFERGISFFFPFEASPAKSKKEKRNYKEKNKKNNKQLFKNA
jgi:hypothetical protein